MTATIEALKALHTALIADGFDPGVNARKLAELLSSSLDCLEPDSDREEIACQRASAGIYRAWEKRRNWSAPTAKVNNACAPAVTGA